MKKERIEKMCDLFGFDYDDREELIHLALMPVWATGIILCVWLLASIPV